MEESETQLHDIKKLAPVALKLKSSRLNELEEYFKMTEDRKDVIIDKTIQIDINETESENETPETTEIIAAPEVTSQQEDDSSEYDFFADYE